MRPDRSSCHMTSPVYSVWRECAAPELGGRQVFVWDGVAVLPVQGG